MILNSEIGLSTFFRLLVHRRRLIGTLVTLATTTAVIVSLQLPPSYRSDTLVLSLSAKKSTSLAAGIMAQVGALGGLMDTGNQGTPIMTLLQSRTLTERVVQRHDLVPQLFPGQAPSPLLVTAVKYLQKRVAFAEDRRQQTIAISAEARTPELAVNLVRWYLEELQLFITENSFTQAKRYRTYVEGELQKNKRELLEAGKQLANFYGGNRISSIASKVSVSLESPPMTVDPAADGTDTSRLYAALETEKTTIDTKLQTLPSVVEEVPQQVYLEYLSLRKELLGRMGGILTQQYEMAKMDEAKDELAFQVIDPPFLPTMKYRPFRTRIVFTTFCFALVFAVILVLTLERQHVAGPRPRTA